jgi:hypothetical protein
MSASDDDDEKLGPGRIAASVIFSVLSVVLFAAAGILAFGYSGHSVRVLGCLILAVAFAIGAWFALRYRSLALEEAREAERAALAEAGQAAVAGQASAAVPMGTTPAL